MSEKVFDSGWFVEAIVNYDMETEEAIVVLVPTVLVVNSPDAWSISIAWLCFSLSLGRVYG